MAKFEQIKNFLDQKNITYKIINLPEVAVSVEDVARLSKGQIKEEEIAKTLIVKLKNNHQLVGCVLPGKARLKGDLIERLATKQEVLQISNVDFGAVCPILLTVPILIDESLTEFENINLGSGDHLKGLELKFQDLLKVLTDYRIEKLI